MEDDEAELYWHVQNRATERQSIRVVKIAEQLGINPIRARELARKWKNDGLVDFADPNTVWLTEHGKEINYGKMRKL